MLGSAEKYWIINYIEIRRKISKRSPNWVAHARNTLLAVLKAGKFQASLEALAIASALQRCQQLRLGAGPCFGGEEF